MKRQKSANAALRKLAFILALSVVLSGCGLLTLFAAAVPPPVEHLVPRVISTRPHDPSAFTEGLLLVDGRLYESTGLYGESTVREVDPETGEVLRSVSLPAETFGEGLALVGDRLLQLTWQEDVGFIYDGETLALLGSFPYADEGWGMCYDGEHLYTSDGSAQITERDPESLAPLRTLSILLDGQPVRRLNELECVGDSIYVNVWLTDNILRIDKSGGRVTALIDASGLLTPEERSAMESGAVLNGIAYDAEQGTFLLTGKLWSSLFEVEFVPASAG